MTDEASRVPRTVAGKALSRQMAVRDWPLILAIEAEASELGVEMVERDPLPGEPVGPRYFTRRQWAEASRVPAPLHDPAAFLSRRPDDIPEADWQQIVLGSTFARVYAETEGRDGTNADGDLDFVGELQEGLLRYGYVIVRAEASRLPDATQGAVEMLATAMCNAWKEDGSPTCEPHTEEARKLLAASPALRAALDGSRVAALEAALRRLIDAWHTADYWFAVRDGNILLDPNLSDETRAALLAGQPETDR